jgi:GNAT superfamily N-acetyltransferase
VKFKVGDDGKEIDKPISCHSFPESIFKEQIWFHISFIDDADSNIKAICSTYSNDKYHPGTIVVSNKIFNEFPIAQSSWSMDYNINRMYVDPFYRSKKIATYSVMANDMLATKLGYEIWSGVYGKLGGTIAGDQLYNSIYDLGFENKRIEIDLNDIFQYRNFSYPVNYIDKRVVYDESTI